MNNWYNSSGGHAVVLTKNPGSHRQRQRKECQAVGTTAVASSHTQIPAGKKCDPASRAKTTTIEKKSGGGGSKRAGRSQGPINFHNTGCPRQAAASIRIGNLGKSRQMSAPGCRACRRKTAASSRALSQSNPTDRDPRPETAETNPASEERRVGQVFLARNHLQIGQASSGIKLDYALPLQAHRRIRRRLVNHAGKARQCPRGSGDCRYQNWTARSGM